ncbi:MAG: HAMP domain-containing histidine kinase [Clostridia bacterium]|nr:HAMP domain-containing histidine kinase [Clostridia bacterium]
MNKARKKFVLLSELSVILLLALLLTAINVISFTRAADEADMMTERIARMNGSLDTPGQTPQDMSPPNENNPDAAQDGVVGQKTKNDRSGKAFRLNNGRFGYMGPNSPEMNSSLRYFTYSIDKDGNVEKIAFRMSAISEEDAENWALSLQYGKTGWTNDSYRYRVYEVNKKTYVTVIDQSRELWPCYRILIISIIGGAVMIIISFVAFQFLGRKLFKPLEDADRKQKQFIAKLENEFKMPLTVISADTETLERQSGSNDQIKSIDKQVRRMTRLVNDLGALSIFDESENKTKLDISDLMTAMLENSRPKFEEKNLKLSFQIEPGISVCISDNAFKKVLGELISNSLKFSVSDAGFTLARHKDRVKLIQTNDTKLPDGGCDQIFDRFTMLENAEGTSGAGLGLSNVKDIVRANDGRLSAAVKDGRMTISIFL